MKEVVGALIDSAKQNPEFDAAGKNTAQVLNTVTTLVKNCLIPIAALNFGIEKARLYFNTKFQIELEDKLKDIPPENLVEPKLSIIAPAMEGLAYTVDEPDLKDMFLNLIAASMNREHANSTHRSYVEIIKSLEPYEAVFLKKLTSQNFPVSRLILKTSITSRKELYPFWHVIVGDKILEPIGTDLSEIVDNFSRLGLLRYTFVEFLSSDELYKPSYDELASMKKNWSLYGFSNQLEANELEVEKGVMRISNFGKKFLKIINTN